MRDMTILAGAVALATLCGTTVAGLGTNPVDTLVIADSLADYGGNQGENGWFYGYYDGDVPSAFTPDDFELMNVYDEANDRWWVDNGPNGPITLIDSVFMHPNAPLGTTEIASDVQWSVRRWVSDINGPVSIDVDMVRGNPEFAGDGIKLHVFVDGLRMLVVDLFANNDAGLSFSLAALVEQGSVIDFAVDPIDNALFDAVRFNAVITSPVPAPGALALVGLGGLVATRRRR